MVDLPAIENLLREYFDIHGTHTIDPDTGDVNVKGYVYLKKRISHFPVKFGKITGDLICAKRSLVSLAGAPTWVGGNFHCYENSLINLTDAPTYVRGNFLCQGNNLTTLAGIPATIYGHLRLEYNPLQDLAHLPRTPETAVCVSVTWHADLPLLRLLSWPKLFIFDSPIQVLEIMLKYEAQGKPGALKAAAELIRAGHPENARW